MSLGASIAGREAELAELRGLLDVFKLCPQVRARGYRVLEAAPVGASRVSVMPCYPWTAAVARRKNALSSAATLPV